MSNEQLVESQFHPHIDPTQREYNLTCRVKVIRSYGQQGIKSGNTEYKAVVLIPEDNDQTTRFYMAWLPEDNDHKVECLAEFFRPIYGAGRLSVHRANWNYAEGPHLFVMSKGIEDILMLKDGERIMIKTLAGNEDARDYHDSDKTDSAVAIEKFD